MEFITHYNRKPHLGLAFKSSSRTQSQFARDCDINIMIQRALAGDISAIVSRGRQQFVDVSDSPESFADLMNIKANAETEWLGLPASVQRAYGNYHNFLEAYDAYNRELDKKRLEVNNSVNNNPSNDGSAAKAEGSKPESVPNT